jgi:hypothetical protein
VTTAELSFCVDYFVRAGILGGLLSAFVVIGLRIVWRPVP